MRETEDILDIFVHGRLENELGRKELEEGEIAALERQRAGLTPRGCVDGIESKDVTNAMEGIPLHGV